MSKVHWLQMCIHHAIEGSRTMEKLLSVGRKLVTHFHQNALATNVLLACHLQCPSSSETTSKPVTVIQDVSTQWSSSFYMIKELLRLKLPILAVLEDNTLTKPQH